MTRPGLRKSSRSTRQKLRSPGRPPVGRREDRVRFWAAIARGLYPEAAVAAARVSWVVGARWFRHAGGMPPTHLAPSAPPLSGRYLSFAEREVLALLRAQGHGMRACARQLDRAPSTISRELRRNAATRGGDFDYRATTAQWHADRAAQRPKPAKLALDERLRHYVQTRLAGVITRPNGVPVAGPSVPWKGRRHGRRQHRRWARAWSPAQIVHRLPIDYPDDPTMRVSHEAIYQALYVQGRGALRLELTACLRTGRALRAQLRRSLTWDQGAEMAEHAQLRMDADLAIYFCDPRSPWQRGTNENTNGLLRQYFPKGTDLSAHGATDLAAVALALNTRPRKTLG